MRTFSGAHLAILAAGALSAAARYDPPIREAVDRAAPRPASSPSGQLKEAKQMGLNYRYKPHQGEREKARRLRQLARAKA